MIKLTAIGHLGQDCAIKLVNGKNVMNFSLAHTEKYKDQNGINIEKTIWVDCSWWNEKAFNIAQYMTKGKQVYVEGTPEVRTYQRNDGTTGASLSLRVLSVQLLGSASGNSQQPVSEPAPASQAQVNQMTEPVDDLPF